MPPTPEQSEADPLRIVLFGLPRAGKTALLAALCQAQETQSALLPGPLQDSSGALTRQRQLFYDELPHSTEEATVTYPIQVRVPGGPLDVELIDCDGRLVLDLLKNRTPLDNAGGTLPPAILSADALLLPCDASLKPETIEKVLTAFDDFLQRHEQELGRQYVVGGLPVYLVLTKCDLLVQEKDGPADWMGRIEEQKRQAHRKLQEFLDDAKKTRPSAFGRLDVHVWATATQRPALGTVAARPREPFGVAELFRQCLSEARQYRERQDRSDRRLRWTLSGVASVAAALVLLTGTLLSGLTTRQPNELQRKVERYFALEGTTIEERLHDWPQDLKDRYADLDSFRADRDFAELPKELREQIEERRAELQEYIPYLDKVISPRFAAPARTETELQKREQALMRDLNLPHPEWAESGAGKLREQRLDDLRLLRERAERTIAWYQQLYRQGDDLAKFRGPGLDGDLINWRNWQGEVDQYLHQVAVPPTPAQALPPQSLITTNAVLRFDKVRTARESLLGSESGRRGKPGVVRLLLTTREAAAALGLTDPTPEHPALLVIPRPPGFPPTVAAQRWRRLESHPELMTSLAGLMGNPAGTGMGSLSAALTFYPGHPLVPPYPDFDLEFSLARVPEAARRAVSVAADGNYRYLIAPLQDLIRKKFEEIKGDKDETPAHWHAVGDWLASNPLEVRPYRRLVVVLDRLRQLEPSDPVNVLAAFLRKSEHAVEVEGLTLTIPFSQNVTPPDNGVLTIRCGPREYPFRLDPEKTRTDPQSKTTTYRFPLAAPVRVVFKPGETCTATLPLRADKVFTWTGSRTAVFAFESLSMPPRQHDKGEPAAQGFRTTGVILKFDAQPDLPAVPDLLPTIRAASREP